MDKKHQQLGMNPSTAMHRLRVDVLFSLVIKTGHMCFRCGKPMKRENFSIEHKEPWLDSANPVKMFFDLDNIAFSHQDCNFSAARRPTKLALSPTERSKHDQRLNTAHHRKHYRPDKRRIKYMETGH